jgi:hypothetical protein
MGSAGTLVGDTLSAGWLLENRSPNNAAELALVGFAAASSDYSAPAKASMLLPPAPTLLIDLGCVITVMR